MELNKPERPLPRSLSEKARLEETLKEQFNLEKAVECFMRLGSGWQKFSQFLEYLVKHSSQRTWHLFCGQAVVVGQFGSYQKGWRGTFMGYAPVQEDEEEQWQGARTCKGHCGKSAVLQHLSQQVMQKWCFLSRMQN